MTYEQAVNDFRSWYPIVKNGGLFAGHDWDGPIIKRAIDEAINSGLVTKGPHIGEVSGFKTAAGWVMNDREGIILNYE